jgi:serine/threonine protein kinase
MSAEASAGQLEERKTMGYRPPYTLLQPGQIWGNYEIRRLLGRSAVTEVYRAYSPALGHDVALKVLHLISTYSRNPEQIQARFLSVMADCSRLDHPGIARVYHYGKVNERFFVAMQLVEGPTLRDVLSERRGGLPEARALAIFRGVAEAVSSAHSAGVIHQDLRPGNILLAEEDRPVVVDFGMMRLVSDDSQTTAEFSPHAPLYMSPEQATGPTITLHADVYSLGILLYEMVTGDVPFKGGTAAQILVQHVQQAPRPPRELAIGLDSRIDRAILRALEKDPAARFDSVAELLGALKVEPAVESFDTIALSRQETRAFQERVDRALRLPYASPPQPEPEEVEATSPAFPVTPAVAAAIMVALVLVLLAAVFLLSQGMSSG